jgi:SAM-dependent methyltransferase
MDRHGWNGRYRKATGPGQPARLLLEWAPRLPAGRALDVACGTGANTLALAEHFRARAPNGAARVAGVDISIAALRIAVEAARQRKLAVDFIAADLTRYPLPRAYFDVICVFRYLDRAIAPALVETLKPGGWLLYQTFTVEQLALGYGPRSPEHLLRPGELRELFTGCTVLHYDEGVEMLAGRRVALASLVARRP